MATAATAGPSSSSGPATTTAASHAERIAKQDMAERTAAAHSQALQCVSPFLDALFENQYEEANDGGGGALAARRNAVPPNAYREMLRRETQKPFHMPVSVSTDFCPLPTRTAQSNYTQYPAEWFLDTRQHVGHLTSDHAKLRRQFRAVEGAGKMTGAQIDEMLNRGTDVLEAPPPERYREVNVSRELGGTHLAMLLHSIDAGKAAGRSAREPVIR
jgi:hypothetical protein